MAQQPSDPQSAAPGVVQAAVWARCESAEQLGSGIRQATEAVARALSQSLGHAFIWHEL